MRNPRFNLRRRGQRWLVALALIAAAVGASTTAGLGGGGAATAAPPNNPWVCGPNDGNRVNVGMWAGDISNDNTNGSMSPCLSGVGLTLNLPANGGATISSFRKLADYNNATVKTADGTTIGNVYHLAFKDFTINPNETGATLSTTSGAASYSLTLAPANDAKLGGSGVITDLLVAGDSQIVLTGSPVNINLLIVTGCGLVGGTGLDPCTVSVSDLSSGVASLAQQIGFTTLNIKSMNLKIYYGVTHTASGGDPDGASFQFPNTTITVGGD